MLGGASCPLESASRFLDEHGPQAEADRDILFSGVNSKQYTIREAICDRLRRWNKRVVEGYFFNPNARNSTGRKIFHQSVIARILVKAMPSVFGYSIVTGTSTTLCFSRKALNSK